MLKENIVHRINFRVSEVYTRGRLHGFVLCLIVLTVFATAARGAEAPVALGSAGDFAVLAGSTVTNVVSVGTTITGDIGVSPGSAVVGFPPGINIGSIHAGDVPAALAQSNLTTAYNDAAGRITSPTGIAGNLGGMTLTPGLYKSTSSLEISSGDLTLDAQGDPNAVFIFQMASTLTVTNGRKVILSGSANAYNIFWQVGSSATFGTGAVFKGTILAQVSITFNTDASLVGRALAKAAVSLDANVITIPLAPPAPTPTPTNTLIPPTNTPAPTNTPVPSTPGQPTNTPVPLPTNTPVPPTNTPVPPTNTPDPSTQTPAPSTSTPTVTPVSSTPTPTLTMTPAVNLGSAVGFAVLAGSTITNLASAGTTITGDIGVYPGNDIVGFPPGIVIGTIYASDNVAAQAKTDLSAAYEDIVGRSTASISVSGNLGGMTLYPGLYKSTSSLEISSGDLTLDAQGDPNAFFIFQIGSTLDVTNNRKVILTNDANSSNIYWQVGTSAMFGTNSVFKGSILAQQSISFNTGATLDGRVLVVSGAVTLDSNTIVANPYSLVPTPTFTNTPVPSTQTPVLSTQTPTMTPVPSTQTPVPPTPTVTPVPSTQTPVPSTPTMTPVPSTQTPVPSTPTPTVTPTVIADGAPVNLGSAIDFAVLAGSTITNVVSAGTTITGDIGVSPGTEITGFPPGILIGTIHAGDTVAAQAQADLSVAYDDIAGRSIAPMSVAGNLGGMTLYPGLYKSTSSLEISSGDLTLDAQGDPNAFFIFQIGSTLDVTNGRMVILSNGANSSNIFWQVGTSATFGTTSVFKGTILAHQSISFNTGATLDGRALAINGAVTLDSNTIVANTNFDATPTPTFTKTPVPSTPTRTPVPPTLTPTPIATSTPTPTYLPVQPSSVSAVQVNKSQIKVSWPSDENELHMLHAYRDGVFFRKFSGDIAKSHQDVLLDLTEDDAGVYVFFLRGLNAAGEVSAWTRSSPITVIAPVRSLVISIYDNDTSLTDISGGTDFDARYRQSLTIGWQTVSPESSGTTIAYHIYRLDASDPSGFGQYIGQSVSDGSPNTFNWKNAPYGTHQIGIFAIQSGKFPLGPFLSGMITLAPAVTVTDDADTLVDLSNGQDTDQVGARELVIRWNFDEGDIQDGTNVKESHVYVKVNDGQYVYLGRTENAHDNMFAWKQTTNMLTAPDFRSGPQFGQSYEFMVFQLKTVTETGGKHFYGPFHNTGPVSFSQE